MKHLAMVNLNEPWIEPRYGRPGVAPRALKLVVAARILVVVAALKGGAVSRADEARIEFNRIDQGAPYQKHWAFEPPNRSEVPAVPQSDSPVPENVPPAELAAYTMVANLLLNLDEVLTRN